MNSSYARDTNWLNPVDINLNSSLINYIWIHDPHPPYQSPKYHSSGNLDSVGVYHSSIGNIVSYKIGCILQYWFIWTYLNIPVCTTVDQIKRMVRNYLNTEWLWNWLPDYGVPICRESTNKKKEYFLDLQLFVSEFG